MIKSENKVFNYMFIVNWVIRILSWKSQISRKSWITLWAKSIQL